MPRIDPLQLLTCLGVLLAPNGGIRSAQEVRRLAGLMAKFSNRLVSKVIYIQILKCTDTELLGQFMGTGGWTLAHMWLQDGILTKNYPLVQEILELLLLCPVDIDRLKSNSAPKLVKQLSKESHEGVRILALKLVEQWLKIVKGEAVTNNSANTTDMMSKENSVDIPDAAKQSLELSSQDSVYENNIEAVTGGKDLNNSVESVKADGQTDSVNNHKNSLVYKITMKDGKQVLAKVESPKVKNSPESVVDEKENRAEDSTKDKSKSSKREDKDKDRSKSKDKKSDRDRDRDRHREKDKKSSSHNSSGKSSSRDKDREKDKDKDRAKSSSSKSSHRDKDKEKDKEREKDRQKDKEKEKASQAEKDKDTLAKIMGTGHLDKLGKIPKKPKTEGETKESTASKPVAPAPSVPVKKPSFSIEQRKDGDRLNTVKKFNSQFRSHGLEEAPPPPASRRGSTKKPDVIVPPLVKPSTPFESSSPPQVSNNAAKTPNDAPIVSGIPEKKLKLDVAAANTNATPALVPTPTEKPQSPDKPTIKSAPKAKGKQQVGEEKTSRQTQTLVETDVFMDALCSMASTNRKDTKKRKRRPSSSKDAAGGSTSSPPESPTVSSPKIAAAPLKFYQDTLEVNEDGEKNDEAKEKTEENDAEDDNVIKNKRLRSSKRTAAATASVDADEEKKNAAKGEKIEEKDSSSEEEVTPKPPGPGCGPNGPPGVLVIHRRKGPKKSVKWRPQEELESIQYFELDETERVNVTKTFTDMKQMERYGEREAFLLARKLPVDDVMIEQVPWRTPEMIDDIPPSVECKSKEKKIQTERESTVLKALYFNRMMIPDSPAEPDMEQYKITDPVIIPLDDGNPENENDFTNTPWPDPKDSPSDTGSGGVNQADQAFNQFNNMMAAANNQPMPQNPWQMPGPPFQQFNMATFQPPPMDQHGNPMPFPNPDDMNMQAMNMGPFPGGPGPNFMPGPGPGVFNGGGFPGDMNNPMMGMNMPPRGPPPNMQNMPPGPWFRPPTAPPHGWRPPPSRNNWHNNPSNRICKLYKKGFCKKGDLCGFIHAGGGGGNRR
ncbi:hypothetical protein DMENIID0001_015820 [Sergentomyia squamirostris]